MREATKTPSVYFANLSPEDIAPALSGKKQQFERYVRESRLFFLWRKAHRFYFSQNDEHFTSFEVGVKGPKAKFAVLRVDHFRSIVRRWVSLAFSQRAALQPIAKYRGYESEMQVKYCTAFIDHQMVHAKLEQFIDECVEYASYLGAAYLEQCFEEDAGEVLLPRSPDGLIPSSTPQPGAGAPAAQPPPLMRGKLAVHAYSPLNVIIDPMRRDASCPWLITRRRVNKHDLIARFARGNPQLQDAIGSAQPEQTDIQTDLWMTGDRRGYDTDDVTLFTFWHERTDAVPDGKRVEFLNGDVVLSVAGLGKYPQVPVERLAPADIKETPFGWTEAWTLIAPQEACDALSSIQLSNARTFGAGTMIAPKASGLQPTDIGQGLKLLEYTPINGMKPEPMQMPQTPNSVNELRKGLINESGTLIGVNSVNRGDPEASLESGSALALVQAQGVESSTPFQKRIAQFLEGVAWTTVCIGQRFYVAEMDIPIVGESLARLLKFSGKSIDSIIRVEVKAVNPLSKTIAGRQEMARMLAERYPDKVSPAQFFRVMETGEWREITEAPAAEESNIDRENELLADGIGPPPPEMDPRTGQPMLDGQGRPIRSQGEPGQEYVRALITDDPIKHVLKHRMVLDSPAARENPAVTKAVLDHIEEHEDKYADLTSMRPGLLQMLGLQPLVAALPPSPAQMSGGLPPEGPGQPAQGGSMKRIPAGEGPSPEAPPRAGAQAKPPAFPTTPAGERYEPPTKLS